MQVDIAKAQYIKSLWLWQVSANDPLLQQCDALPTTINELLWRGMALTAAERQAMQKAGSAVHRSINTQLDNADFAQSAILTIGAGATLVAGVAVLATTWPVEVAAVGGFLLAGGNISSIYSLSHQRPFIGQQL